MAEAMLRAICPREFDVFSAGVDPWLELHPVARKIMAERGEMLRGHFPKHVQIFRRKPLDYVVTIGDRALETRIELRGNPRRIHWAIDDPAAPAGHADTETMFRAAQSRIEEQLRALLQTVRAATTASQLHLAPAISTHVYYPEPFEPTEHLSDIARAGFRAIELSLVHEADFDWRDDKKVAALKRAAADCNIRLWSVHAPGARNDLASHDPSTQRRAVDDLKGALDLAAELGAAAVPVHSKFKPQQIRCGSHSYEAYFAALTEACDYALPLPCVLALENPGRSKTCFQPGEIARRIDSFPDQGLGFVCDTGHLNILQNDMDQYLPSLGPRLRTWHFNDNMGDEHDPHLLPGAGAIDWDSVMKTCVKVAYTGPLVLEVIPPGGGEVASFLPRAHQCALELAAKYRASGESD